MQVQLNDEDAQVAFGEALGKALQGRGRVYLEGDLGAGKTTLTRGILRAHGHRGAVKSPTYTLVEPYEIDGRQLYHLDLYRLGDPEELEFIGGRELFDADSLCIIEWPSRGEGWLPPADVAVTLNVLDGGRHVTLQGLSAWGKDVLMRLEQSISQFQQKSDTSQ